MSSIKVSPKHGINPSLLVCPICGESTSIALLGRLKGDAEAPHSMIDTEPCEKCEGKIKKGYRFMIEVRDGETGSNPYRTGRVVTITNPDVLPNWKHPISFAEESVIKMWEKQIEEQSKILQK